MTTQLPGEVIFTALADSNTLHAVVADKIFPTSLPQGDKLPCVIYRVISAPNQAYTQTSSDMLCKDRVQFDCWASTHHASEGLAKILSAVLRSALGAEIINSFDGPRDPAVESRTEMWCYIVEAYIWHEED